MFNPTLTAQESKRIALVSACLSSVFTATSALASIQPLESENPFESNIPAIINSSGGGSDSAGGDAIGDAVGGMAGDAVGGVVGDMAGSTIGDMAGSAVGDIAGDAIGDMAGNGSMGELGSIFDLSGLENGQFPSSGSDVFNIGLGSIFGKGSGPVPEIFDDIMNGDMGGILETVFGVLIGENRIFEEMMEVVLGDDWKDIDGDGKKSTPPDPYKVRLPNKKDKSIDRNDSKNKEGGILTRSPIVLRRDRANAYDQTLGRAMAAPMLAEAGNKWLGAQISNSSDMMQAGLKTTQSAVTKSTEATDATSTQEIVRRSAEISGMAATLQMQEMQQNALMSESLWNMQRLQSAQLQLAANSSEAADEQNRRDRASRAAALSGSAYEAMIIPGLADVASAKSTPDSTATAPPADSLFVSP
ncbi:hypothetical protein S7335_1051 [Synechococcus sp. PCC 7335]|uniref:hypothetical protein n=1 Tax=Synechococcus sp. (strain ATCC 29403 / PCC 7335) TaxID=91464 RepID=UPI00017ECF24|nr:hypothetical protein [Synechococcus sp. PCC 7335]EDX82748.1 hypothetical protein S7335_1051 [Synechococcus sp. PCC 7335]